MLASKHPAFLLEVSFIQHSNHVFSCWPPIQESSSRAEGRSCTSQDSTYQLLWTASCLHKLLPSHCLGNKNSLEKPCSTRACFSYPSVPVLNEARKTKYGSLAILAPQIINLSRTRFDHNQCSVLPRGPWESTNKNHHVATSKPLPLCTPMQAEPATKRMAKVSLQHLSKLPGFPSTARVVLP